jgi:DnaJ-class molecular chaperone
MYDLAVVNEAPGQCGKCRGTGVYSWGATINGKSAHSGTCFSCRGTGKQSSRQISRNRTYNRHKVASIVRSGFIDVDRAYEDQCADICGR